MTGVDTNVLLRFALADDPVQTPLAASFLHSADRLRDPAVICPVALVEFVWTLMRREKIDKHRTLQILDAFALSRRIVFSDGALMTQCIERWRRGEADLADYLIAALNEKAGAASTVTFDRTAAREPPFTLLGS